MLDSKGPEEPEIKTTASIVALGVVFYLALGLFLWWLLNIYVDPSAIKDPAKEASAKRDLVQALGLIMAGAAGAVGIFFTWRNLQQGQANLKLTQEDMKQTQEGTQESLRLTQEQVQLSREDHQLTRQSQITERFTTAIELLGATNDGGSKNLEQRLGAIHILVQIAKESNQHTDSVIAILSTYVRQHAPRKPAQNKSEHTPGTDISPELDIETILYSMNRIAEVTDAYRMIILPDTDLRGADLFGAKFRRAYLLKADLSYAYLMEADLTYTYLPRADLTNANLRGANLKDADLSGANLIAVRELSQEQIEQANGDERTSLPEVLTRPASWSEGAEEPPNQMPKDHT